MSAIHIRQMTPADWPSVAAIYKEGMATGNATFQQEVPSWDKWNTAHLTSCRLIALVDNDIAGWAALTPVSGRCVYAGVAEVSVYVAEDARGKGVGNTLLTALINCSEQHKLWTLQAGIFPENISSVKLHEKHGFRTIGYREKIGKMNNTWRDTVLMERRSKVTGL